MYAFANEIRYINMRHSFYKEKKFEIFIRYNKHSVWDYFCTKLEAF